MKLREISDAEDIPSPFLASILQRLVGAGLLRSSRGPTGGYALTAPPGRITLHDIKAAIDGTTELEACAVGLGPCSDEVPCPLHDSWKPIREEIRRYLQETTLEAMAEALARKRADAASAAAPGHPARGPGGTRADGVRDPLQA